MNTAIVRIDVVAIEELLEKTLIPVNSELVSLPDETALPVNQRFGIVDLWKIRSAKRHFSFYR